MQRLYKHYPDSVSLNAKQVSATYKKVATRPSAPCFRDTKYFEHCHQER